MDFNDLKYDEINSFIQKLYKKHKDWNKVKDLSFVNNYPVEMYLDIQFEEKLPNVSVDNNLELWKKLVDFQSDFLKEVNVQKLGKYVFKDRKSTRLNSSHDSIS